MAEPFAAALQKIVTSQHLGQSLDRAHRLALDQRHGVVTLEHVLFALTDDVDAGVVLSASKVDIERLRGDISGFLGRLSEQPAGSGDGTARPSPDLLRILQAAAAAARQSPRKHIDGAIVLAAMVGDANTPAAGLLKAHGLTFEEAIKALQLANAESRTKAPAPPPAAPAAAPTLAPVVAPEPPPARTGKSAEPSAARSAQPTPSTEELLASVRARIQEQEPPVPARQQVRVIPKRGTSAVAPSATAAPTPPANLAPTEELPPPKSAAPLPPPPLAAASLPEVDVPADPTAEDRQYDSVGADAGEPEFRIDPRSRLPHTAAYNGVDARATIAPQPPPPMPPQMFPVGGPGHPEQARRTPPPLPPLLPAPALNGAPGAPPLIVPGQLGGRATPPLQPSGAFNGTPNGTWPPSPPPQSGSQQNPGATHVPQPGRDAPFGGSSGGPSAFPRLGDRLLARPDLMRGPAEDAIAPLALNVRKLADRVPKALSTWQQGSAPTVIEIPIPRSELPSAGRAMAVTLRLVARDGAIGITALTPETLWLAASPAAQGGSETLIWRWSATALQAGPSGIALSLIRTVQTDDGRWLTSAPQEHKFAVAVANAPVRKAGGWGRRIALVCMGILVGAAVGGALWMYAPQVRALAGL